MIEVVVAVRNYEIKVIVDKKEVSIKDSVETNFLEGEVLQLTTLFYRTMLACGFPPAKANEAMGKVAISGGFGVFGDGEQDELNFGVRGGDQCQE
jgi:hypothetical protein